MSAQQPTASCTKTSGFEAYTVRASGEWATIAIRGWQAEGSDNQPREIGEILIHSSFGSWAHQWGHLGEPFRQWLTDVGCDYIATKFMGSRAYQFDGEASLRELRQNLISSRRYGDLDRTDARQLWDWIDENEDELMSSENDFVWALERADTEIIVTDKALNFLSEPWEYRRKSIDRSFSRFWEVLWPVFLAEIKAEAA